MAWSCVGGGGQRADNETRLETYGVLRMAYLGSLPPAVECRDGKFPAALQIQVHLAGISGPDVSWGRGVPYAPPQPAGILGVRRVEVWLGHSPCVDRDPVQAHPGQVGALVGGSILVGFEASLQAGLHHEYLGL